MTNGSTEEELRLPLARGYENTYGIPVGNGQFLVTATTLASPGRIRFGTVVQTFVETDGRRWISNVVTRSPYRSAMRVLSASEVGSPEFETLQARLTAVGGAWEQLMGGS